MKLSKDRAILIEIETDDIDEYIENKFMTLDYPVWLSISAHSKCKYIHEFLSSYRILGTSISILSCIDAF